VHLYLYHEANHSISGVGSPASSGSFPSSIEEDEEEDDDG